MRVHLDEQGHFPTYVVVFDPDAVPEDEVESLHKWACEVAFPNGTFALELRPSAGTSLYQVFVRARDVETFLYGFKHGWTVYQKLWLEKLH